MKWYVLTLFLLVGLVCSASAQQSDPALVGDWETTDGPCRPCILRIQPNGTLKFFDSVGSEVEIIGGRVTPEPGVDLMFPLGGKLDISLTKSSNMLVGYYTNRYESR